MPIIKAKPNLNTMIKTMSDSQSSAHSCLLPPYLFRRFPCLGGTLVGYTFVLTGHVGGAHCLFSRKITKYPILSCFYLSKLLLHIKWLPGQLGSITANWPHWSFPCKAKQSHQNTGAGIVCMYMSSLVSWILEGSFLNTDIFFSKKVTLPTAFYG